MSPLIAMALAGCGASRDARPQPPAPLASATIVAPAASTATPAPSSVDYGSVFDALASQVESLHVFAEGRRAFWDAHKAELRREMADARTREEALAALRHVQLALGDKHCYLSPPGELQPHPLRLGLSLFAERQANGLLVRVASLDDPSLAGVVNIGDELVAVDGVPLGDYVASHPFESSSENPVAALQETVASAVSQTAPWSRVAEGQARVLTLRREGKPLDVTLHFRHPSQYPSRTHPLTPDEAPDMSRIGCADEDGSPYPGYDVAAVGANVCIYRARGARSARAPVVRFLSFNYDSSHGEPAMRSIRADHDLLARELARDTRVVLDVHQNHGGVNPFIFLSWFAQAPWGHPRVHVRVSDAFSDDQLQSLLWGDDANIVAYKQARARGESEISFISSATGTASGRARASRSS